MKISLKDYLKIGVLLFTVSLSLWNCREQDDTMLEETVREKKIQTVSFEEFKEIVVQDEKFKSISPYFKSQVSDESVGFLKSPGHPVILTGKIIKVAREAGVSYTFRLLSETVGNEFYNLVLNVDDTGTIQKSVILEYLPSEVWLADTTRPFSGHVKVHDNAVFSADEFFNGEALKTEVCYEVTYEWECNAGNNHEPNTCTAGGSDLVVTYFEVSCSYEGGNGGDGVSFPVGEESPSGPGGGGGSGGGSDPGADSGMSSPMSPGGSTPIDNAFFDDQVFIDDSFKEHPCLKTVYDAMGKATKFSEYLHHFEPDFSVADLRFLADDNFKSNREVKYHNATAITDPPLASNLINITFNTDSTLNSNILTKPDVYKAVAMIHEILHAEMYRKMLDALKTAEINQTTLNWTTWTAQEFKQFIEALENKYSGILDYFTRYKWQVPGGQQPTSWQHQAMAQHYRDIIKQALTGYDPALTEAEKEALSWLGLNDANVVAWQNLMPEERTAINDIQTQIKNTFPNGCN